MVAIAASPNRLFYAAPEANGLPFVDSEERGGSGGRGAQSYDEEAIEPACVSEHARKRADETVRVGDDAGRQFVGAGGIDPPAGMASEESGNPLLRSEEHTSELQSLMRIS